jgi:hypothetical protein
MKEYGFVITICKSRNKTARVTLSSDYFQMGNNLLGGIKSAKLAQTGEPFTRDFTLYGI